MAENKKSFLIYSDLIYTVEHLSDEDAGKVFKWTLDYVNDNKPKPLKGLLAAVCEPIKQQLKRDLLKYESKRKQYSEAGKKSAEARRLIKEQTLTNVEVRSTKSTVNDNVNVTVNDIKKKEDNFLSLFNKLKEKKTSKESKFKILSPQDQKNFKKLKNHSISDFKSVINTMLESKWCKENNNQTPSHILRIENFNRYLSNPISNSNEESLSDRADNLTQGEEK